MPTLEHVIAELARAAPLRLAEEWDNVGLLVGDRRRQVERIMTCLTITPSSAAEAIAERADLIVAHHPLPFRPLKKLTSDSVEGRLLLELIGARVAIYSAHTAFDSAAEGINQHLAAGLELTDIGPLVPAEPFDATAAVGAGRMGRPAAPLSLGELAARVKHFLQVPGLHLVGDSAQPVTKIALACGSGGDFLPAALRFGCDALVTGEARFHTCLAAEAESIGLVLPGHYASERFALESLAARLAQQFPTATVWPSRTEQDPLRWIT